MQQTNARCLVVGHVTHDRYEGGVAAGGCAFYGARAQHGLGAAVHLLAVVGEDFTCGEAIADLDKTVIRDGETTVFANFYPDDGPRVQLVETVAPDVTLEMYDGELDDFDFVHLAPVLGEIDLSAALELVPESVDVGINVQGWIKRPGPRLDEVDVHRARERGIDVTARRVVQEPWRVDPEQLVGVTAASMSTEDLLEQGDLLARLKQAIEVVVVTNGIHGSSVFFDGECWEVGVYETDEVDPTGAGDVFAATLYERLAADDDPVEAARLASAAASIAVEAEGPGALHRLGEAFDRADHIPAERIT